MTRICRLPKSLDRLAENRKKRWPKKKARETVDDLVVRVDG